MRKINNSSWVLAFFGLAAVLGSCDFFAAENQSLDRTLVSVPGFNADYFFAIEGRPGENDDTRFFAAFEIKNGRFLSVSLDGSHKTATPTLKEQEATYGARAEALLLEKQQVDALNANDTNLSRGAVERYKKLLLHGLDMSAGKTGESIDPEDEIYGRQGEGPYVDGVFSYTAPNKDENGWWARVTMTVSNGYITAANWSPINEAGDNKKDTSAAGLYGMEKISLHPWWQEAEFTEQYLIWNQDPEKVSYSDDEGHTDDISGATLIVSDFYLAIIKIIHRR